MKNDNKRYLNSKEVAWILDCSPGDVIELVNRGKLEASKEGRIWKFREEDVMAYKRLNSEQA